MVTIQIAALFALLAGMVYLFLTEKLPVDLTAFLGLVLLVFAGYVTPSEAFQGFSSPAVITMLSVFILGAALLETGVADVIVTVQDDGPGLPPVPDAELFRRGFSTKGRARGRGLALVDDLLQKAGGTLLFGRLERGTLARVRIPRG